MPFEYTSLSPTREPESAVRAMRGWCLSLWAEPAADSPGEYFYAYKMLRVPFSYAELFAASGRLSALGRTEALLAALILCLERLCEAPSASQRKRFGEFVFRPSDGFAVLTSDDGLAQCLEESVMDALHRDGRFVNGEPLPHAHLWRRIDELESELGSNIFFWVGRDKVPFFKQPELVEMCQIASGCRMSSDSFSYSGKPIMTPFPTDFYVGL